MPIRYLNLTAVCEGVCTADEAEPLARWLSGRRAALVHLGDAEHLHTAVVQVLLAANTLISASPQDPLLQEVLDPLLSRSKETSLAFAAQTKGTAARTGTGR